eukprot:scaffold99776_cov46-Tisochrysis_lutea.AAC.1
MGCVLCVVCDNTLSISALKSNSHPEPINPRFLGALWPPYAPSRSLRGSVGHATRQIGAKRA